MPERRYVRAIAFLLVLAVWTPRAAAAQAQYHIIAKGETLYSIARSYGVAADAIAKANSIDDPSKLRAGVKLLIPRDVGASSFVAGRDASASRDKGASASVAAGAKAVNDGGADAGEKQPAQKYTVVKGDTLFSISRTFGVSLDELRSANKMKPNSVIKAGEILAIPAGAKPAASVAKTGSSTASGTSAQSSGTSAAETPAVPVAVKTSAKAVSKGLSWPCSGDILYLDGKAYGVVIRSKQGEAEKAIASGIVSSAGPYRGYGNVVFVLSRGYIYVYGGNESISVRAGDRVSAGQELGKVGLDAKQGGPAAYFLVFKNGQAVDPATAPRD